MTKASHLYELPEPVEHPVATDRRSSRFAPGSLGINASGGPIPHASGQSRIQTSDVRMQEISACDLRYRKVAPSIVT
jgi:hypothetical protein